jgi:beta-glucosidase
MPLTTYATTDDLPPSLEYDVTKGYTYQYYGGTPLFPFGYGLTYTTFALRDIALSATSGVGDRRTTMVSCSVTNTGSRPGDAVVEMYVRAVGSAVPRPIRQLRGFSRVALLPGETRSVSIPLTAKDLAYWDSTTHAFVVEPLDYVVELGQSASDISLSAMLPIR